MVDICIIDWNLIKRFRTLIDRYFCIMMLDFIVYATRDNPIVICKSKIDPYIWQ